jgi:plastocyanin
MPAPGPGTLHPSGRVAAARLRRLALALVLVAALAAAALAIPALARTRTVKVGDNYFVRARGVPTVVVKRGSTVRWVWRGTSQHNVTVYSGPRRFKSRTQRRGSFAVRMTRAGTYRILCTIHGRVDQSMVLKVKR